MTRPHQLTWSQVRALDHEREMLRRFDRSKDHEDRTIGLILALIACLFLV